MANNFLILSYFELFLSPKYSLGRLQSMRNLENLTKVIRISLKSSENIWETKNLSFITMRDK